MIFNLRTTSRTSNIVNLYNLGVPAHRHFSKIEIERAVRLSVASPRALRVFHCNPSRKSDTLRYRFLDAAAPLDTLRFGLFEVEMTIFFNDMHFYSEAFLLRSVSVAKRVQRRSRF